MAGKFHHEELYRGRALVERLALTPMTLCGAGALGSNLAENLARQGFRRLRVIDRDRVEEHNVSTQVYGAGDVGAWKVDVLKARLFRAVGVEIEAVNKDLSEQSVRKLLKDGGIVVDTFDNSASRRLVTAHCRDHGFPCLHVGLFADYGEVVWNDRYRVPADAAGDVCDYPLARNLVLLTVAVATETLLRHIGEDRREDWSITLRDFAVRPLEAIV
jgi:molybdopterin/thiamine biosynthesis adenylyltransferase